MQLFESINELLFENKSTPDLIDRRIVAAHFVRFLERVGRGVIEFACISNDPVSSLNPTQTPVNDYNTRHEIAEINK